MAITTMFRDYSVSSTEYSAADFARVFRSLFGSTANSGPLRGALNGLAVSLVSGRTVQVASGQGLIRGWWFENSASYSIDLAENSSTLYDRMDRVVARLTFATQNVSLTYVTGTPASSPAAPDLAQNTTYWDIPLATTTMTPSEVITSVVDTREFCEFAHQSPRQSWVFLNYRAQYGSALASPLSYTTIDLTQLGVPVNSEAAYVYLEMVGIGAATDWWFVIYAGPTSNSYRVSSYKTHLNYPFRFPIIIPLREGQFTIGMETPGVSANCFVYLLAYRTS